MFQINRSEVDLWERKLKLEDIKLMLKEGRYPPKVSVVVYSNSTVSKKLSITLEIRGMGEEAVKLSIAKDFSTGQY